MAKPVNPFCQCDPCECSPICLCGLKKTEENSNIFWDANEMALRHTVTCTYRPTLDAWKQSATSSPNGNSAEHSHHESSTHPTEPSLATPLTEVLDSLPVADIGSNVKSKYEQRDEHGHEHDQVSVRTTVYKGHRISIRTKYEISINDRPIKGHIGVSDEGDVHYHGLPNYADRSAIDVMKAVVDAFPDDFPTDD